MSEVEQLDFFKPKLVSPDTPEWHLAAFFEWKPIPQTVRCPQCLGSGKQGGGFKSFEEEEQCDRCFGSKSIQQYPDPKTKPEYPKGLQEHMKNAWNEFFTEKSN